MKVCVIQPYYSFNECDTEKCFDEMLALLDKCDGSLDLIVLPEYSDIPAAQGSKNSFHASIERHNAKIMECARAAAVRCGAIVFVNAAEKSDCGYRNTTHAIDREGNIVGKYFKAHPAPSEVKTEAEGGNELDVAYSYEYAEPYVIEIEGIRFGFMTCYDFYFYESFAPLARQNVDVIIGCSHQRTDTHEALSIINRFLCYNTNAYLIRSSVSLGEDSKICGCSSVIAPDGRVIVDMKSEDNKYLHRDFHLSGDLALKYCGDKFGKDAVIDFLSDYVRGFYAPTIERIKKQGLTAIEEWIKGVYEVEEASDVLHTSIAGNRLTVTIDKCPVIEYMRSLNQEPSEYYVEETRTLYATVAAECGYNFTLEYYNADGGAKFIFEEEKQYERS